MLGCVFAADVLRRLWNKDITWRHACAIVAGSGALVVSAMWLAGYFMVSKYTAGQGCGFYRMNLLAPIDPMGRWSLVLPSYSSSQGDFEGVNFFGLGVLGLLVVAGASLICRPKVKISYRSLVPLFAVSICFAVFAVSNRVAFGNNELVSLEVPGKLWPMVSTFRSTGRFFWPFYYLIYIAALFVVFTRLKRRPAFVFSALMLCLQVVDSSNGMSLLRGKLSDAPAWSSPLESTIWSSFAARYKSIVVIQPAKHYVDYMPLAHFAVTHRMRTNAVYLARVDQQKLSDTLAALESAVHSSDFDSDVLYVFGDDELWKAATDNARQCDVVRQIDGFRVLAPNFIERSVRNSKSTANTGSTYSARQGK